MGAPSEIIIAGIDLAWGEKKHDGVCFASFDPARRRARLDGYAYPQGDDELVAALAEKLVPGRAAFAAIDAPIVCPNATGARRVDRLTHTLFHRQHAACHPANLGKCPRPPRVLAFLRERLGFAAGWGTGALGAGARIAAEVYPHPAMVRMFGLTRIIKYKKGPVAAKRREFRRLQRLLRYLLTDDSDWLALDADTPALLGEPWSKPVEDRTDALFCALIALRHVRESGERSEVIGDLDTGFILLPAARDAA